MSDKARRIIGVIIGPLLIVVGLWLFIEGVWHVSSSGGFFWVGPFLAIAGGLWMASDWFEF